MKILYICSNRFDYLQDLTYAGLVKVLGKENVVDYPWNPKFNLPIKSYPKNLGFKSISFRFPFMNSFKEIDFVILASAKKDVLESYLKILPLVKNKPILFLDGGDFSEIGGDFYREHSGDLYEAAIKKRPFDIILKREYISSLHAHHSNIFPFPFSFPYNITFPTISESFKKYDVSFWGQQYPQIRTNALNLLAGKYDCNQNGTTLDQNFQTYKRRGLFYLEEISRCKIVLNFRGFGWDTMRYWEVPATGTFMISQEPKISIPNNFESGKHLVWCSDSLDDLIDLIDYYLARPLEREKMAINAREHLIKYHLNTARAATLIEIVQRIL
jgi:hypothetical protein